MILALKTYNNLLYHKKHFSKGFYILLEVLMTAYDLLNVIALE